MGKKQVAPSADGMRIDSHKLMFHVERVNDWQKGRDIAPIFLDVSPTSACNHRCIFCGLDFAHAGGASLSAKVIKSLVSDAARIGVKSIMYAGEGEPLLHRDIADVIKLTSVAGIDAALNTNGVLMTPAFSEKALPYLTWVRVSIDAGSPLTYARIHATRSSDFHKVLKNLEHAVRIKKEKALPVTIGTQFLLLKENEKDAVRLAKELKRIRVDYLIIKPYSKHPLSSNDAGTELDYRRMLYLEKKLERLSDGHFRVIFRERTMRKRFTEKPYKRCLGAPFWAYVSATGDVYPCHTYLGLKKMSFGNLNKRSFSSLWKGRDRRRIMRYFTDTMDARKCRELCRLDEINTYLWQLKHPHPHVNFI